MKLYSVDFEPMYPVPSCLIIQAKDAEEARTIAEQTIKHTNILGIKEIAPKIGVVIYLSGDY